MNALRPSSLSVLRVWVVGCAAMGVFSSAAWGNEPTPPNPVRSHGPLTLDDAPEPLRPEHRRSESDRNRVEALALFAAGHMHERREEFVEALRCYQRALRCDPRSGEIVQAIIPVAVRLKRFPEAVRYAARAVDLHDSNPLLLRRLSVYLTEEGDWQQAVKLYEKSLAARGKEKEGVTDILLRMEMGRLYHLTGKYKPAAECFAKVGYAIDHPDEFGIDEQVKKVLVDEPGPTYNLFGECFLLADRPEEALAAFKKADELAPNKAEFQFNLARLYAKTGKPAEALDALESSLAERIGGKGMTPYETLAETLKQLGKSEELLPRLEKLRAADPANMPLAYFVAAQYREAGKPEKAESLYREVLKNRPSVTGYRALVEVYVQAKRYDALLATLSEAMERLGVLEGLGAAAQSISNDAETMRGIIDTARNMLKSDAEQCTFGMRLAAGLLALEAKRYDAAGEFLEQAMATKPKQAAEVLLAWGVGLLMGERWDEAAKVFQRGIDEKVLADDNPALYFYLAGALAMAGRTEDALAAARKAADIGKESPRYRGRVAWVLYFAKRYAEAKQAYAELVKAFDAGYESDEARDVLREARLTLSNLCVLERRLPEAEEWLEQVLDEFPDDVGAMNDLGYLWADANKKLDRAEQMIRQAVDAEPENMAYRDSLGWVLLRRGQYDTAVAELEKAAADKKVDGVVFDHLGDAYLKAGQRDKALEAWRRAAEAFRRDKEEEKAKDVEKKVIAN